MEELLKNLLTFKLICGNDFFLWNNSFYTCGQKPTFFC